MVDTYLHILTVSGLLARRQNAWSQDGGNMRVIANGVNRRLVSRSACGRFFLVLVYRVMPRILIFQAKYNYTRPKFPYFAVVSSYSFIRIISISTGRCSLFEFSAIIYLLATYCR